MELRMQTELKQLIKHAQIEMKRMQLKDCYNWVDDVYFTYQDAVGKNDLPRVKAIEVAYENLTARSHTDLNSSPDIYAWVRNSENYNQRDFRKFYCAKDAVKWVKSVGWQNYDMSVRDMNTGETIYKNREWA